jgi:hypothetical protein
VKILEYLSFKRFIMPYALQVLFWAGIGGNLYGTWWLYTHNNWAWVMSLSFGTLLTRLIFENFILRFQSYQCMHDIRRKLYENDSPA